VLREVTAAVAAGAYAVLLTDATGLAEQARAQRHCTCARHGRSDSPEQVTAGGSTAAVLVPDASALVRPLALAFYEDPASSLTTLVVTGSPARALAAGTLVRALLAATQQQVGLLSPQGYELGALRLTPRGALWEADEDDPTRERACTTPNFLAPYRGKYPAPSAAPDALGMQQLLAGLVDLGADTAVVTVSPAALSRGQLAACRFDVAVFAGLDAHALPDDVSHTEALFASALSDAVTQRAVVCVDDPASARVAAAAQGRAKTLTYSGLLERPDSDGAQPDVYPLSCELSIWDTAVTLATPLGDLSLRTTLVGAHAVAEIAAAVAVGVALGVPLATITAAIEGVRAVPGQLQSVDEGQPFAVIVDGARSVEAIEASLKAVRDCGAQHLITVVGATAGTDRRFRAELGRMAHQMSDVLIVTTDNPDGENVFGIIADVVSGFDHEVYSSREVRRKMPRFPFLKDYSEFVSDDYYQDDPWAAMQYQSVAKRYVIADRFHAIRAALGMASDGDAVVLLGKGAEDWQLVNGSKHWFSDTSEARAALTVLAKQPKSLHTRTLPYRIVDWPSDMNDFIGE
jgi:UDP-N-acetylmuramyl tripeptide synthase